MDDKQQANAQATQNAPTTQNVGGEQTTQAQSGKTFTQEQLEQIISERLARERGKYADYDALKKQAQEAEDAKKSEIEKAAERATKAETRLKEIEQSARLAELRASAQVKAVEIGFDHKRLDKVLRLVEITGDSTVETIASALESLAKEMPELLTRKGVAQTGATNPARDNNAMQTDESKRIKDMAMNRGNSNAWFSGGKLIINEK